MKLLISCWRLLFILLIFVNLNYIEGIIICQVFGFHQMIQSRVCRGKNYISQQKKRKNSQLCFEFLYCCSLIWRSDLTCGSSSFFTFPAVFPNPSKPLCSRWDSEANIPSFPYCFLNFARSPFVILRVQNADISENEGTIKSARNQSR